MSQSLKSDRDLLLQLKKHFGFESFRGEQESIIRSIINDENSLVLMPTGMGKSLCYQFPAQMREGLVLVISPLIALMQDQSQKAQSMGIAATFLSSTVSREDKEKRLQRLTNGELKLLFVTPERFRKTEFLDAIKKTKIQLLAIDEAHCISQWGHDFRTDYSRVGEFRELLGNPQTIALTATATEEVQTDILKQLRLDLNTKTFSSGIHRPNLHAHVHSVYGLDEKVRNIIGLRFQNPGPAIVYVSLISTLNKLSEELNKLNIEHLIYHGQLRPVDRKRNQNDFLRSDDKLILATPAFGLGVDKNNVRLLIHAEIPGSIESYYQEIGRAGRDGELSQCHLFYDPDDVSIQMDFVKWANPEPDFIIGVYRLIEKAEARLHSEGMNYLREKMNFYNSRDYRVETSVNLLELWGCIEQKGTGFGYVAIESPSDDLIDSRLNEQRLRSQNKKLLEMVQFCEMTVGCRMQRVYSYFGYKDASACGVCDLCLKS